MSDLRAPLKIRTACNQRPQRSISGQLPMRTSEGSQRLTRGSHRTPNWIVSNLSASTTKTSKSNYWYELLDMAICLFNDYLTKQQLRHSKILLRFAYYISLTCLCFHIITMTTALRKQPATPITKSVAAAAA